MWGPPLNPQYFLFHLYHTKKKLTCKKLLDFADWPEDFLQDSLTPLKYFNYKYISISANLLKTYYAAYPFITG